MLTEIRTIARDAGATILRFYQAGDLAVESKADGTPVTDASTRPTVKSETHCGPWIRRSRASPRNSTSRPTRFAATGSASGWSIRWTARRSS